MVANKVKPSDLEVDKKLLLAVKSARRKYVDYMEEEAKKKKPVEETVEQIAKKKKQEEIEQIDRDIHLFTVGLKEADTAVQEAGKALQALCGKQKNRQRKAALNQCKDIRELEKKNGAGN